MNAKKRLFLSCMLSAATCSAADIQHSTSDTGNLAKQIDAAIFQFESTILSEWAYIVERYENEEGTITQQIEKFEPNNANGIPWLLLELNGKHPNQKQLEEFNKQKRRQQDPDSDEANFSISLRELIQLDSLQLIEQDTQYIVASFDVYLSQLGEDASEDLTGTLKYAKHGNYIEHIHIVNTAPLSPMFTAKITELEFSLSFLQIDQAILPEKISLNMFGTFAIFTEIDEVSVDTFSDYEYRGAQLPVN